jgi:hypothetical protein
MAKHKLKLVEPNLQEQLDAAITLAAELRASAMGAAKAFKEKYPEDRRLIEGDLAGTVPIDSSRDVDDPFTEREPKRTAYLREGEIVEDLWRQVREADNNVELLRARLEAAVTEDERRAALAAAIDDADKADTALQKLRATVARADGAVADAQERHGDAATAVITASEAHARLFEQAIEQGHPPGRDSAVRDARRLADDAADELAVAKTAAAAMKAKLGGAEYRVEQAHKAVVECARNIVAAIAPKLLAEAQQLRSELEARRQILSVLNDMIDSRVINSADRESDVGDFLAGPAFPYEFKGDSPVDHPAVAPWLKAIEALQIDAEAPLPTTN